MAGIVVGKMVTIKHYVPQAYFYCKECNVVYKNHIPYYLHRFEVLGIRYAVPIINGKNPQCPNCKKDENVQKLKGVK